MNRQNDRWVRRASLFLFLSLAFCPGLARGQEPAERVQEVIREISREFVPDRRLELFEVEVGEELELHGVTTLPGAREALLGRLEGLGLDETVTDRIVVLPHPDLGSLTWGLVTVSVSNLRTRPGHSQELTSQALLGTPLRILMVEDGWYRVRTPEGYIAWLDAAALEPMDRETLDAWNAGSRMMFVEDLGFLRTEPGGDEVVSDITLGGIVQAGRREGNRVLATLPDGRAGWLPAETLVPFARLETGDLPEAADLISLGRTFMGRPYLWGGTSSRGVDCSGFMKTLFYLHGVVLSRDANQQVLHGEEIAFDWDWSVLRPGDLMFFGRAATADRGERVSHVGMYVGDGRILHSSGRVRINSLVESDPDFSPRLREILLHVRRLHGVDGEEGPWSVANHPWY